MEKKHREKIRNTGKTQGILSRLECGHPVYTDRQTGKRTDRHTKGALKMNRLVVENN